MKRGWAAFALILAGIFGPAAALADPMPIRVGWVVPPGHLAPLIEALGKREPGVFKHLGQSYVLQTTRFQGTTPQIQAQAIGDLDVAALSTAALALAITNAKLEERVVADVVADGVEGFFTENYVVAADSPIKTIEDIKGKRIATNAIGSASDVSEARHQGCRFHHGRDELRQHAGDARRRQSRFDRHLAAVPAGAAQPSQ